ncbi:cytochrome b5-like heme/steroid binding domain-containing protein [Suillus paluster]|uniref:cytochrome b5-like heme/steroid binding domain-containing protein n=1 Tax=Suillus paluster TaxID=48578 RepID=UPI001B8721C2|nr:cytochrome b5-like heme/steroid binding domain-containing protein [Suillus paluster]KAG1752486.1 cytochrome b5-like heme/steroid binding domain-containing protein [Suillus paluster]
MVKVITYEELKAHSTKDSLYVLIHGEVYDATKFIDEHPGGDDVILAEAAKDATQAFEDVGHSDEAREILATLLVGEFEKDGALKLDSVNVSRSGASVSDAVEQGSNLMYFVPLTLLGAYFAWRFYGA